MIDQIQKRRLKLLILGTVVFVLAILVHSPAASSDNNNIARPSIIKFPCQKGECVSTSTSSTVAPTTQKPSLPPTTIRSQPRPESSSPPPSSGYRCHNRPAPADPKAFIYFCESGNNPAAVNAGGCRGLGQACPGSKLPCSATDYDCQDKWFTNYMLSRYGTWENARAFWLSHQWW